MPAHDCWFRARAAQVRDNLDMTSSGHRISQSGMTPSEAERYSEKELAIKPRQAFELSGIPTMDPEFDVTAVWIDSNQRNQAQTMGRTVVDASTVMATYLSHVIQLYARESPGREKVRQLLGILGRTSEGASRTRCQRP